MKKIAFLAIAFFASIVVLAANLNFSVSGLDSSAFSYVRIMEGNSVKVGSELDMYEVGTEGGTTYLPLTTSVENVLSGVTATSNSGFYFEFYGGADNEMVGYSNFIDKETMAGFINGGTTIALKATATAAPEPTSGLLLLVGGALLGLRRKRRVA